MADLVIDTDVVSFGFRQEVIYTDLYGPAIQRHRPVISFMTLAELQFARSSSLGQREAGKATIHAAQSTGFEQ